MSDKLDLIYEELKLHRAESKKMHDDFKQALEKTNERVDSLESTRDKAKAFLAYSAIGGTGSGILAFIAKIFGGGSPPH